MWQFAVGFAIALILTYVLAPKPQNTPPAGIDDIKAPTAEDGKPIPVLFGCRDLRGPNVIYYGNLKTTPIKSKGGKK